MVHMILNTLLTDAYKLPSYSQFLKKKFITYTINNWMEGRPGNDACAYENMPYACRHWVNLAWKTVCCSWFSQYYETHLLWPPHTLKSVWQWRLCWQRWQAGSQPQTSEIPPAQMQSAETQTRWRESAYILWSCGAYARPDNTQIESHISMIVPIHVVYYGSYFCREFTWEAFLLHLPLGQTASEVTLHSLPRYRCSCC